VQQAVLSAFSTQRFVEIYAPKPASTIMFRQQLTLTAHACCFGGGTFEWVEGPRNGTLTPFATGPSPAVTFDRPPGPRTLEVRWTVGGTTRTDRIDYTLINQPPVVSVQRPFANEQFFASDTIPLRASAIDETVVLDDSAFTWRIDGALVGTGRSLDVPANSLTNASHTAQVTVTDGNLSSSLSRAFTVTADPPHAPTVTITAPAAEQIACPEFVPPDNHCRVVVTAVSSDTGPGGESLPAPTINWSYQLVGTVGESSAGTSASGASIAIDLPFVNQCPSGWVYNIFARVNDGTSTRTDLVQVNPGQVFC
jgi:hypothetical protein